MLFKKIYQNKRRKNNLQMFYKNNLCTISKKNYKNIKKKNLYML